MTPAQIAKIMALVDALSLASYHTGTLVGVGNRPDKVEAALKSSAETRAAVEAALRDAPQAEPTDTKDAARYRQLLAMKDKAAPETIAHYVMNPAHLDRVIEVMEQKP